MASTKILIIDDEQDVIDLLTLHLRKAGFALRTATDGATEMAREAFGYLGQKAEGKWIG
jgi:DNA-binding response OmpR family regulator